MEEVMLAHAGAAGEFSIILEAPLPTLQRYRRNATPPAAPRQRGAGERDELPARLRREGSVTEDIGHVDDARSRRGGPWRARPDSAHGGSRGEEEEVDAPVHLRDPRGMRRESARVSAPPARVAEVKPVVPSAVEEVTPLQQLARGGRSSSANRRVEATPEKEALAARPSSRRSRRGSSAEDVVNAKVAETAVEVEAQVESWPSSQGSEDGGEEAMAPPKPLEAVVTGGSSRSNSPAIINVNDALPKPLEATVTGSHSRSNSPAISNVNHALPKPLEAIVTGSRSRSNSPAISNVNDYSFLSLI
jgi:hypothetical protein